jgi:hypothetical protein
MARYFVVMALIAFMGMTNVGNAAEGDGFIGRWVSNDYDGIQFWDAGNCGAVIFSTRLYSIARRPVTNEIMLSYHNETQVRYIHNANQACRATWQNAHSPIAARLRSWDGDNPRLDHGVLAYDGRFDSCQIMTGVGFASCPNDPTLFVGPFSTKIALTPPYLSDLGDPSADRPKMIFHRESSVREEIAPAEQAYRDIVSQFGSISAEVFFDRYWSKLLPWDRNQSLPQLRTLKVALSHIVARDTIEARYFDQANISNKYVSQPGVILLHEAKTETGISTVETIVMLKEPAGWKVSLICLGF